MATHTRRYIWYQVGGGVFESIFIFDGVLTDTENKKVIKIIWSKLVALIFYW